MEYTQDLANLIEEFQKLPGIGPKSAQRMAFFVLKRSQQQVDRFLRVIRSAKENIHYCETCFNLTTQTQCEICSSPKRDQQVICAVAEVKDLVAIERTGDFKGLYHVLGGLISPLDGVSADDLTVRALLTKVKVLIQAGRSEATAPLGQPLELILAFNSSTEGEATLLYLKRMLENLIHNELAIPKDELEFAKYLRLTRLAYGLPVGADLDYTDEMTLSRAIDARVLV